MSDDDGMDNPAFTNEDSTKLENGGFQQVTLDQDSKSSGDGAPTENGHQRSFISQHYVEPIKPSAEPCYKTETRIELPADNAEKSVPEPKLNGVHGNGNNNDASFLNNSSTSVQINDTGKKEQIEAVNLELVSMRPYTGNNIQTKGQEACEVPTDPYEEYFVPVNEHRKYIRGPEAEVETTVAGVRFDLGPGVGREGLSLRDPAAGLVDYSHWLTALRGEKLYVTKDKRSKNSYWRRMAWGCALLVVAIAVIIAILAATGVIFTQEATEPLTNVDESNTNQLNEVHTAGSQEYAKNPPSSPPPSVSSLLPWHTTDETIRQTVPDALDGILRLDNLNWSDDLNDTKSRVYRQVSSKIERYLGDILRQTDDDIHVHFVIKVYNINKEGEVKFRINHFPLGSEESQKYIEETLRKNGNMIGQYHLSRLQVGNLVDQCEYSNECSEKCEYDYFTSEFVCSCEPGKILSQDNKTCVDDLSNVEMDDVITHSSTESSNESENRSRGPTEVEPRSSYDRNDSDFKTKLLETPTSEPKIKQVYPEADQKSAEHSSTIKNTYNFEDNHSQWNHEHSHHSLETTAKPEPAAEAEPSAEPEPAAEPEPSAEPEPAAEPEPSAEPEPAAEPEPSAEPEPAAEPESSAEPEPADEPEPSAEPEPVAEPEPSAKPEPAAEPELSAEPEPAAEPEPSAEPEPAAEPEPTAVSKSVSVPIASSDSTTLSELTVESEPTTVSEPISKSVLDQELVAKPEPTVKSEIVPEVVSIVKEESVIKEKPAVESAPVTEPIKISNEPDTNAKSETIPYLITTQLNLESNTEISHETESVTKSMSNDDTVTESVTQLTLLNHTDITSTPKSLTDLPSENNNSKDHNILTTTMKINETPIDDDDPSLHVLPLRPKNNSTDMGDEVTKMESTTLQSYTNKDEISESTTIEGDLITLDHQDSKLKNDENVTAIKLKNNEESSTVRIIKSSALPENKENDYTTEINRDENISNIENKNSSNEKHDLIVEQQPSSVFDQPVSTIVTTTSVTSLGEKTEATTKSMFNERHFHTIEINGVSRNTETYNAPKIYGITMTPETTSTDTSTKPISSHNDEHVPHNALQTESEIQDSNEKNVIEHMPTTVFPKVPKNFAHNVEPLKEPVTKSANDEHIMLITKSEEPLEIHAIIPELIPEQSSQSTNESRQGENSTMELNNGVSIKDSDAKQLVKNTTSIASSTIRIDQNIDSNVTTRSDEVQEHSTNHPLHPAVLPENLMSHVGKPDANDDRHVEDMSPFLPDVNKEKENSKKAPRLDKDEQDVPNPFETHIDDVITHRPLIRNNADVNTKHKVNKTKNLLNDGNLHLSDKKKTDITEKITESKANVNMSNSTAETIQNNLDVSDINNNTELELGGTSRNSSAISNNGDMPEDTIKNNSSSEENSEILKVIPLAVATSQLNETSSEVNFAQKKVEKEEEEGVKDYAVKNRAINSEKPEENAVEDQYNDITDENLSKEYKSKIKVVESKKAVLDDVDPVSYKDTSSLINLFKDVKEKNDTNERTTSFDSAPTSTTEKIDEVTSNNQTEDVKLTTQEPVLPIEIQQEMSTTVATDKIEMTTMIDEEKQQDRKQPNVTQFDDREVTAAQTTTTQSTLETKTTAQVPILPDELQTTENEMLTTTTTSTILNEDKGMKEIVEKDEKESSENIKDETAKEEDTIIDTSERSMAATTVYESNVRIGSTRKMEEDDESSDEQSRTTTPSPREDAKIGTTPMTTTVKDVMSDVTIAEDVRPVTEMVDDTPMIEFDYRNLFTTTPRLTLTESSPEESSEEAFTVIPLEKSQESNKKKPADKKSFDKYKYKKEKDLNLEGQEDENVLTGSSVITLSQTEPPSIPVRNDEEVSDSAVSSEIDPNLPKFVLVDTEGNILPVSTKKNIESTDKKIDAKPKNNYPTFIPVSEDIIEPIPVTESYMTMMMRNYTYPATASSVFGTASTAANETIEGRANDPEIELSHGNAKETTEQPAVTFVSDQSFGDEETEVDRVTKEPTAIRLTVRTTPLRVESATIASSLSRCTTGQFQCANGTSRDGAYCIPLSAKCDSEKDCSDGSDEADCVGCPDNFRCASGQCLKRHLVCNRIPDCNDGSDEQNCENWECQSDEFRCPSGKCIPALWQCNNRPDCEDHRDEYNCAESCGNNEYLCPTEKWCIPQTWRCNGIAECVDGEDEKLCDCSLDQFECQNGGCVSLAQVCDGVENCPDYSDEWDCLSANVTADRNLPNAETYIDTDSNTTSESTDRVPLLKIRQYNGDYQLVCWDGWSEEFSDSYCRALGFAGAETTESSSWNQTEDTNILRLKTNPDHRQSLVTNLQQVEFCVSGKVVRVSCEEFACGMHHASEEPTARSIDGTSTSNGQWPSVALLKEEKDGVACTASILGPLHAVASYSCIYRNKKRSRWQLFTGNDMLKGYPVKNIIPYPQVKYNQFLYNNDVALIELEEPLVLSRNISAVCLPRQSIQPWQICVTVGWGFPASEEINLQQYHKFLSLPTYDSAKCNATSPYAEFITEHDICADFTDTDKGPCYNDEGAPLMCVSESQGASERWEIQGLLSHRRCSRGPAIYSSTEPVLSWLRETVPALRTQS